MDIYGYVASLIIGISLGLMGGGGSIITVPVLVYLFGIDPVLATAYSLFIVGGTSLVGAYSKYKEGLINIPTAIVFGIPSISAVFTTRKFIIPMIPKSVFFIGDFEVTKGILMMVLFAFLMILASVSMIRKRENPEEEEESNKLKFNFPLILASGIAEGTLTGLVGAGGGFLIIPALVLLSKLSMKKAVGTSLLIIAAKSLIGFTGDLSNYKMNWQLLISVTGIAIVGIFIGNWMNNKVSSEKLKKGFGWFILVMGIYILVKELFLAKVNGEH